MNDTQDNFKVSLEKPLIELAIESWRFIKLFTRVIDKLDAGESARYSSQIRYFLRRVEDSLAHAGLKLVNLEGHAFDPGIAATALNIGDFSAEDQLIVDQMVEPIVVGADGLRRAGTVTVRKVA